MKHGRGLLIVALVVGVLAVTLALSVSSGLATISPCHPRTQGATVYGPETFGREPGVPAIDHRQFDTPADGDLCLLLEANGCGAEESEERSIP